MRLADGALVRVRRAQRRRRRSSTRRATPVCVHLPAELPAGARRADRGARDGRCVRRDPARDRSRTGFAARDGRRDHARGGRVAGAAELPLRLQGRGRRRGVRGGRARGPGGAARRSRGATRIRPTGWPRTSTSPSGQDAESGGCGWTRGASRCTRRWCATRSGASTSAGARCSPRCWPTACARAAGSARTRRTRRRGWSRCSTGSACTRRVHGEDVPPERAAAWARRLAELELGVTLPAPPPPVPPVARPRVHETRIAIRARDLDAAGHVDPAVLFTFLEEARAAWLGDARPGRGRHARRRRLPAPAGARRRAGRRVHARRGRPRELPHARDGRSTGGGVAVEAATTLEVAAAAR